MNRKCLSSTMSETDRESHFFQDAVSLHEQDLQSSLPSSEWDLRCYRDINPTVSSLSDLILPLTFFLFVNLLCLFHLLGFLRERHTLFGCHMNRTRLVCRILTLWDTKNRRS